MYALGLVIRDNLEGSQRGWGYRCMQINWNIKWRNRYSKCL